MTIPRQKIEREWKDPDESPGFGVMTYFNYFNGKFFLLIMASYFIVRVITNTPITITGLFVSLVMSITLSPLLSILYQEILKAK